MARYFNAGTDTGTDTADRNKPLGGGDITSYGAGKDSGLFQHFDFLGQQDLENMRAYNQMKEGLAAEQQKRAEDEKIYQDSLAKFAVNPQGPRNTAQWSQQLMADTSQLMNQANNDPLFRSALMKMQGRRNERMTDAERQAVQTYTGQLGEKQRLAKMITEAKPYEDEYLKQRTTKGGEELYTPQFEQAMTTPVGNPEQLQKFLNTQYMRTPNIQEEVHKNVLPFVEKTMDSDSKLIALNAQMKEAQPGSPVYYRAKQDLQTYTEQRAKELMEANFEGSYANLAAEAAKQGIPVEQLKRNLLEKYVPILVTSRMKQDIHADEYQLARQKQAHDEHMARLKESFNKAGWRPDVIGGVNDKGETINYDVRMSEGDQRRLGKKVQLTIDPSVLSLNNKAQNVFNNMQGNSVPTIIQGAAAIKTLNGKVIPTQEYNALSPEEKKKVKESIYQVYSTPDPTDPDYIRAKENYADDGKTRAITHDAHGYVITTKDDKGKVLSQHSVPSISVYRPLEKEAVAPLQNEEDNTIVPTQQGTGTKAISLKTQIPRNEPFNVDVGIEPVKGTEGSFTVPEKGAATTTGMGNSRFKK